MKIPYCLPQHISSEQFLSEYWQKKPLLIKQGLPQLADMFEPDDILGLALEPDASARLITQHLNTQTVSTQTQADTAMLDQPTPEQWQVKTAPLSRATMTIYQHSGQSWCKTSSNGLLSLGAYGKPLTSYRSGNETTSWCLLPQRVAQWVNTMMTTTYFWRKAMGTGIGSWANIVTTAPNL